jgi:hypothetical protein
MTFERSIRPRSAVFLFNRREHGKELLEGPSNLSAFFVSSKYAAHYGRDLAPGSSEQFSTDFFLY